METTPKASRDRIETEKRKTWSLEAPPEAPEVFAAKRRESKELFFKTAMPASAFARWATERDGGIAYSPEKGGIAASSMSGREIVVLCSSEQGTTAIAAVKRYMDFTESVYNGNYCARRVKSGLARRECPAAKTAAFETFRRRAAEYDDENGRPPWAIKSAATSARLSAAIAAITAKWREIFGTDSLRIRAEGFGDSIDFLSETFGQNFVPNWKARGGLATKLAANAILVENAEWIRESYRRKQNPLPGLRKRAGGTWEFSRGEVAPGTSTLDVRREAGGWVTYQPT